jgi:hypothetical protein
MPRTESEARVYCSSIGFKTVWKSSKSIICTKGDQAGKKCGCDHWRLVVFKNGGVGTDDKGAQFRKKAGSFYCGHAPCNEGAVHLGGIWKPGKHQMVFKYIAGKYPQHRFVSSYCPKGSTYLSHACGNGAKKWTAKQDQKVQWGPWHTDDFMDNKRNGHCAKRCNCNAVKVACVKGVKFVDVKKRHPQNANVGSFCPKGTIYVSHVCGTGANKWTGSQKVQFGPYTNNAMLKSSGHCSKKCNCNKVRVKCQAA